MQSQFEENLTNLETEIDKLKQMKAEFDRNNEYFAQLLQRMEQQIQRYELGLVHKKDLITVQQGVLLSAYGLMSITKNDQHGDEPIVDAQYSDGISNR